MSKFSGKYERSVLNGLQFSQYGSVSTNAWWGLTNVASTLGGYTAAVSTTIVRSDSIIQVTVKNLGLNTASGDVRFAVSSLVDQVGWTFTSLNSCIAGAASIQLMWTIANPVKVDGVE